MKRELMKIKEELTFMEFMEYLVNNEMLKEIADETFYIRYFVNVYMADEYVMDLYEKYCYDNKYFEDILHPVHAIEDHYGIDVQNFLYDNTDYMTKYAYYTIDANKKAVFYTEKMALDTARENLTENFEYVIEHY